MSDVEDEAPDTGNETQQTQPAVDQFVKDIFGDSDDDDDIRGGGGDGGAGLEDSDDDGRGAGTKSRLKKGKKKSDKAKKSSGADKIGKKTKGKKEKKRKGSDADGTHTKRAKRDAGASGGSGKTDKDAYAPAADDGDEYDSEDVVANADDDAFLADEDDALLAGVVGEYGSENQVFDDERPNASTGSKKGKKAGGGTGGGSTKAKGVFEETLAGMKKKKVAEISDVQKQEVVTRFLKQMDQAAKDDDAAFARKEPAVHKLNILKKVQDMVGVKDLQGTLLDFDVLGVLSDWVSPKSDNTLPSHTIRTAVYHMLDILPTQSEHLKRKQDGTQRTVGMVVMSLYRHKQETRENKAVLRALIEKWSRPIFRKGADARSKDYSGNDELHAVVNAQLAQRAQAHAGSVQTAVSFDDAITQRSASDAYAGSRARCPFSGGFLYTAKPQSKNVVNAEQSSTHDQVRRDMLKKMSDMKNANRSGFGRKENKNTMEMEKTGRNKA